MVTLQDLPRGKRAVIRALTTDGAMRRRLLDIGFVPDTQIICLFAAFSGDPRAYLVKNTVIALRADAAQTILIEQEETDDSYRACGQSERRKEHAF